MSFLSTLAGAVVGLFTGGKHQRRRISDAQLKANRDMLISNGITVSPQSIFLKGGQFTTTASTIGTVSQPAPTDPFLKQLLQGAGQKILYGAIDAGINKIGGGTSTSSQTVSTSSDDSGTSKKFGDKVKELLTTSDGNSAFAVGTNVGLDNSLKLPMYIGLGLLALLILRPRGR